MITKEVKSRVKEIMEGYKYGFSTKTKPRYKAPKGLNEKIIKEISAFKKEPSWMTAFRLKAYKVFRNKQMPVWGADLSKIDFNDIYYYIKPTEKQVSKRVYSTLP